jgi:hypothetical protein
MQRKIGALSVTTTPRTVNNREIGVVGQFPMTRLTRSYTTAGKNERQAPRPGEGTYRSELCFRVSNLAKTAPQTNVATTTRIRGHRIALHRNVVPMPKVRPSRARLSRFDHESTCFMRSSLSLQKSQRSIPPPQNTADKMTSIYSSPVPIRLSR